MDRILRSHWLGLGLLLVAVAAALLESLGTGADAIGVGGLLLANTYALTVPDHLIKLWRKVQGQLLQGINFIAEEMDELKRVPNHRIDWSAREITHPVDLHAGAGVAAIGWSGWEARPSSPPVEEITLTFNHYQKRFDVGILQHWIEQRTPGAQVESQMRYQALAAWRTLRIALAEMFYGFSTAVRAVVHDPDGNLGAAQQHTLALRNAYGTSSVPGATAAERALIASLFKVDSEHSADRIALIRGGMLVAPAYGRIVAKNPSTPSITVDWGGVTVQPQDGDEIVLANAVEPTLTLDSTMYNRGLVGLLEAMTGTSVHGLSRSAVPAWAPSFADTSGGRFSAVRFWRMRDAVQNNGPDGADINVVYISQGVYRDLMASERAALRHLSGEGMSIDGSIKSQGVKWYRNKRMLPGWVVAGDIRTLRKMQLLPEPGRSVPWGAGEKIPDRSARVFSLDFPFALVWTALSAWAYANGLDEQ